MHSTSSPDDCDQLPHRLEFVDTHAHLDDGAFDVDRDEVILRARAAGLGSIVLIGYHEEIWDRTVATARSFAGGLVALGLHPQHADEYDASTTDRLRSKVLSAGAVAIGETGIDLFRDGPAVAQQQLAFRAQLDLAWELRLPTIIHQRAAEDETLSILMETPAEQLIVLHSFDAGERTATIARDRGWYLGIGGLMTRVASDAVRRIIRDFPMDRLLLETDSPYLVPTGVRMRRNEPANVVAVAERLAELRELPVNSIASETTANARRVFHAPAPSSSTETHQDCTED